MAIPSAMLRDAPRLGSPGLYPWALSLGFIAVSAHARSTGHPCYWTSALVSAPVETSAPVSGLQLAEAVPLAVAWASPSVLLLVFTMVSAEVLPGVLMTLALLNASAFATSPPVSEARLFECVMLISICGVSTVLVKLSVLAWTPGLTLLASSSPSALDSAVEPLLMAPFTLVCDVVFTLPTPWT